MLNRYDETLIVINEENRRRAGEYGPSTYDFFVKCVYLLIPILIVMTVYYEYTTPKVIKKARIEYGRH